MLTPKQVQALAAKAAKAVKSETVEAKFADSINDGKVTPLYHGYVTIRFNGTQNSYGKYRYAFTHDKGFLKFSSFEKLEEGPLSHAFRVTDEIDGKPTKETYYTY